MVLPAADCGRRLLPPHGVTLLWEPAVHTTIRLDDTPQCYAYWHPPVPKHGLLPHRVLTAVEQSTSRGDRAVVCERCSSRSRGGEQRCAHCRVWQTGT